MLWANVAIIIVRVLFISLFLFYCLLCNHSFQTNPNRMTNCLKLILLYLQLYQLHLLNAFVAILIFDINRFVPGRHTFHLRRNQILFRLRFVGCSAILCQKHRRTPQHCQPFSFFNFKIVSNHSSHSYSHEKYTRKIMVNVQSDAGAM